MMLDSGKYCRAGRKALTLYSVPPLDEVPSNPLLTTLAGRPPP